MACYRRALQKYFLRLEYLSDWCGRAVEVSFFESLMTPCAVEKTGPVDTEELGAVYPNEEPHKLIESGVAWRIEQTMCLARPVGETLVDEVRDVIHPSRLWPAETDGQWVELFSQVQVGDQIRGDTACTFTGVVVDY